MFSALLLFIGIVFVKADSGGTRNFTVRLNNSLGNDSREGRLEIYYAGSWGTVCDSRFTNISARVACSSLGFGYIGELIGRRHGAGSDPVWLNNVRCVGTEGGIHQCIHDGWGKHTSHDHNQDVSIRCGNIPITTRLSNSFGNSSNEGRLEIYYSGRWGTVCDDSFSNLSASVACASLGFANIGTVIGNRHGNGTGTIWLDDVICTGTETGIEQCRHNGWGVHNCGHNDDVSISCEDLSNFAVRLINSFGNNSKEGRLEIYYSGRWGTVCGDYFTDESARVACASLRFGYIGTVIGNRHGAGTGTIWLDDVNCIGTETGIEQCVHNPWGIHNCDHQQDVSIICDCGTGIFHRPTGKISSPNFPLPHGNRQDCKNYIRITSGHAVIIAFLAFRTKSYRDWITITCESGNNFRSPRYSDLMFPAILTISSCNLVNVYFHSGSYTTYTGFSLTYDITSDNVIGGLKTKPSNAFPRSDSDEAVIFNCTTVNKYFPWWTINDRIGQNYTITNSTCGVITSVPYSSWFVAETFGPGSCNLIVVAPGNELDSLAGSLVCTDSTLSSARAILAPINLQLRSSKGMNSLAVVTGKIGEGGLNISCNPSFTVSIPYYYRPELSLVFTYRLYYGGPVVRVRILRIYWTSGGNVVSSIYSSNTSSYILVKAPNDGLIPPYTCNIVCDFFSNNISDIIEISFSTETEVSYKAYQNLKHQVLILVVLLGVAILTTIMTIVFIAISCNFRHRKGNTATVVQKLDDNE